MKTTTVNNIFITTLIALLTGCVKTIQLPTMSVTETPSQTLIPQIRFTETPSFSLVPTLNDELFQRTFIDLLDTGCDLPCWWNIYPGMSKWIDVDSTLRNQGISMTLSNIDDIPIASKGLWLTGSEEGVLVWIDMYLQSDIITQIHMHSEGFYNNTAFRRIWFNYSPELIMSYYGSPSRVLVKTESGEYSGADTVAYTLYLFYDPQGFLLEYYGVFPNDSSYRICPTFGENGNIGYSFDIILISANQSTSLENVANIDVLSSSYKNINLATELTLEQFYMQSISNHPFCFETLRELWP